MQHSAAVSTMPQTSATANVTTSSGSSSNIERIFLAALKSYKEKTKKDLKEHDLFRQLETCDSPAAILAVFQAKQFDSSRAGNNDRLKKWLTPTINVLYAFSNTLGEGISLVFPPAKVIFAGVGVLLLAAKDVAASEDVLIDIFGRIESFCVRLENYTNVPLTPAMMNKMVQITVEILHVLAIATKEMKQGQTKKFFKRVIGRTKLEDGLNKLDKLTNEEVAMACAQLVKVTNNINNTVTRVDAGVSRVDENVLGVKSEVELVNDNVKAIDDKVKTMVDDGKMAAKEVKVVLRQTADGVDDVKRKQLRESLGKWQSPPDPSTNQHIVGGRQHKGTTDWFIDNDKCHKWKAAGSLLWVHGKPGSGKSVLCSAIINDVTKLHKAGLASVAYFYFDFRDVDKRSRRNLLASIVVQLSTRSNPFCDILARLYEAHDNGARQPGDQDLTQCLKEMLTLPDQGPVYLIMDALDECPDTSDVPSAREQVLNLVKDFVDLRLPNLRICVTSRPEVDISDVLESLASQTVSLETELGQRKDISDYIRAVVYSGSGTFMRRWRKEDKEHVIMTLSERADGMFRWVFCQLEMLRNCLPQNVRRVLQELPSSLDETYERMLRDILKANPDQAYRLLQCLTVATRPLRVDELAEILALNFDSSKDGIPALNKDWRWDDEQQGVLATCSSLIVVVDSYDYSVWRTARVVQFAHFSVKEFLTSDRLADIKADISRFHIRLEPAHTVVSQACLAILLQSDHDDRANSTSPLSKYAAQHWVDHARFGNVSLRVEDGMRRLFDPAKPCFTAWLNSYDCDREWTFFIRGDSGAFISRSPESKFTSLGEDVAPLCLYYAALCGLHDLTRYLITKYPQHLNARVGRNKSPLAAALINRHLQGAGLLHQHGAVLPIGYEGCTLLHAASADGLVDVAQWLLNIGADASAHEGRDSTPIDFAATNGHLELVRILLDHGVDVNGGTEHVPLCEASSNGHVEIVQLLIERGADVHARDQSQSTPLHLASSEGETETVQVLIKHGADVNARDEGQSTPLHLASFEGETETVLLLIDHGADINAWDECQSTPLHLASSEGKTEAVRLLINHGADVNARDQSQSTPLHLASSEGEIEAVQLLIDHRADLNARDECQSTPLHLASSRGYAEASRLLIEHGADLNARNLSHSTPLHLASSEEETETMQLWTAHEAGVNARDERRPTPLRIASRKTDSVRLLIEYGADVNARNQRQSTPLHLASSGGYAEASRLLIEHGADLDARNLSQSTPLHLASSEGKTNTMQLLIDHGAYVNARDESQSTPLHLALWNTESVQLLIEHGADVYARDHSRSTPLHLASSEGETEVVQLLIEYGVDVNARDQSQSTPLHLASSEGETEAVQLLIEYGADVNARDQSQSTPLHLAQDAETVQLLVEHGADVHARDQYQLVPLHYAWNAETVQLLIKHGADVHARNQVQSTPLHIASSWPSSMNMETTVRLLVEHGASVNAYDKNDRTPLHWLSSCSDPNPNSLCLLLESGADVEVGDDKGLTPFQIASAEGHDEIAQLLLDHRGSIMSNML